MILKALSDYYERMLNDPECDVAPPGWFLGKLDYVIVLDSMGNFKSLRSLQTEQDGRFSGRKSLLPFIGKQALKHTNSGKDANLLWDNGTFVMGLGNKGELKLQSFIATIEEKLGDVNDNAIKSVLFFLNKELENPNAYMKILAHPEYGKEIGEGRVTITFQQEDDTSSFLFQRHQIKNAISNLSESVASFGTCLATGKTQQPIELCHVVIKNLYGAKKDPNLTSFNQPSFTSYGKEQGFNSPVSKETVFAYTTALNHLLRKESQQHIQVGDASTVFWAQSANPIEDDFSCFLGDIPSGEEDIPYGKIRSLLKSVRSGVRPEEDESAFYVLGIAPMGPRLAVRFWFDGTVRIIKERIVQHFEDLEIINAPHDCPFLPLRRLLLATTRHSKKHPYGEDGEIAPKLASDIFRAVLNGSAYPRSLLQKIVNRVKAEQGLHDQKDKKLENVTYARAALIKGFLVRDARLRGITTKEVGMALDKTIENPGYVLGRLFAVLESIQERAHARIQERAHAGLNRTIRDTYFSAATSNPLVIFKRLQDLAIHHLAKIRNSGKSTVWLDKLMQEVMGKVPASGVPVTLTLEDQGRFAVGYYHQRQDFFNKNENETKENNDE